MFKTVCIVSVSKYTQFYHCVDMGLNVLVHINSTVLFTVIVTTMKWHENMEGMLCLDREASMSGFTF